MDEATLEQLPQDLAGCEFEDPYAQQSSREAGRQLFLAAVWDHHRPVIEEAFDLLVPLYRAADDDCYGVMPKWWYALLRNPSAHGWPSCSLPEPIWRYWVALWLWSECRNLNAPWLWRKLTIAISTEARYPTIFTSFNVVAEMLWKGKAAGVVRFHPAFPPDPAWTLDFSDSGYNPTLETRRDAEARLRGAFEDALRAHLNGQDRKAKRLGLVRPLRKTPAHFSWLARYQFDPTLSMGQLANLVHRDRKTVEDALKRSARLLGLQLRPPAPAGRPHKAAA